MQENITYLFTVWSNLVSCTRRAPRFCCVISLRFWLGKTTLHREGGKTKSKPNAGSLQAKTKSKLQVTEISLQELQFPSTFL